MLGANGPEVLEVNSIPGLTDTSLLPMAAEAAGIGFVAVRRAGAGARSAGLRLGGLLAEPTLLGDPALVDGDDQQRRFADVAEAVWHLRRDDDELIGHQLEDLLPPGPAAAALEQDEGLG